MLLLLLIDATRMMDIETFFLVLLQVILQGWTFIFACMCEFVHKIKS